MTAFRKKHSVLRKFTGNSETRFPEIQVMGVDGYTKVLRVIFAGRNESNTADDIVCLAINTFWEEQEFTPPYLGEGKSWYVAADTSGRYLSSFIPDEGPEKLAGNTVRMGERSVCILVAE